MKRLFRLSSILVLSLLTYALSGVLASSTARADAREVINALRDGGCVPRNRLPALHIDTRLQAAVRQIANGINTDDATQAAAYPTMQLSAIRLTGYTQDDDIRRVLQQKYCSLVMKPEWQDVGIEQRGDELLIVLAVPHAIPASPQTVAREILSLVNEARSSARHCGNQSFMASTPLRLSATLNKAAQQHADDMARHRQMQHEGSDGSSPSQRVTSLGYRWKAVGENVAAGAGSASEVVTGWLHSPGHCANIMNPVFTEMGIAFAVNKRDDYAVYWAQEFAMPR